MPVYVFSYHTKLSWMPDHPRGYVQRNEGILPPDASRNEEYWRHAKHPPFVLSDELQRAAVDEVLVACKHQKLRPHFIATEPTHVHALVSWRTVKSWKTVRTGLKTSLTKMLRRLHEPDAHEREFLSDGSSRKHIRDRRHFDHWMTEYGPKHFGWKWREGTGLFK